MSILLRKKQNNQSSVDEKLGVLDRENREYFFFFPSVLMSAESYINMKIYRVLYDPNRRGGLKL